MLQSWVSDGMILAGHYLHPALQSGEDIFLKIQVLTHRVKEKQRTKRALALPYRPVSPFVLLSVLPSIKAMARKPRGLPSLVSLALSLHFQDFKCSGGKGYDCWR